MSKNIFPNIIKITYTTNGRDRFHWATTPVKPYKVGNICYMTYRYSVLYFLNLSLKRPPPPRKRQFLWKYPNPETVIAPCFNAFAHAQSTYFPIDLTNITSFFWSTMNIKHENHLRDIHPVRHAKHPKQILQTKHIYSKIERTRIWFCRGGGGGGLTVYVEAEYVFPIFCARQYFFSSNFRTDHLF